MHKILELTSTFEKLKIVQFWGQGMYAEAVLF